MYALHSSRQQVVSL